jgi:hypothetical protein
MHERKQQALENTTSVTTKTHGVGSVYLGCYKDKDGNWLDGGNSLPPASGPPNAPVKQFWSLDGL